MKNTVYQNQVDARQKTDTARIEQRIERALEYEGMKNNRTVIISAYPHEPSQLKILFLSTENSIRRSLEQPPLLRPHGWGLNTRDQRRNLPRRDDSSNKWRSKGCRFVQGRNPIFVRGLADTNFLASPDEKKQKLNPLAIVEVFYGFLLFYKLVLEDMDQRPDNMTIGVDFRNLHKGGVKTGLAPYARRLMDNYLMTKRRSLLKMK